MSHKILRQFIVKVPVLANTNANANLGYFPLYINYTRYVI